MQKGLVCGRESSAKLAMNVLSTGNGVSALCAKLYRVYSDAELERSRTAIKLG